jgi:hypothetical protein
MSASLISLAFTDEAIAAKLREIGFGGRVLVSVDDTCAALACSRSHFYAQLIGEGRPLRYVKLSEKIGGTYAVDIARLLLERERNPLPVRPRGAHGRPMPKKKTGRREGSAS